MKPFILTIMVLTGSFAFSQSDLNSSERYQQTPHYLTLGNIERYGLDYELVNYNFNGDSTILESLDLLGIEQYRNNFNDVEIDDYMHNVKILLYSGNRVPGLMEKLPQGRIDVQEGRGNRTMNLNE